jgi:hypothetical protein
MHVTHFTHNTASGNGDHSRGVFPAALSGGKVESSTSCRDPPGFLLTRGTLSDERRFLAPEPGRVLAARRIGFSRSSTVSSRVCATSITRPRPASSSQSWAAYSRISHGSGRPVGRGPRPPVIRDRVDNGEAARPVVRCDPPATALGTAWDGSFPPDTGSTGVPDSPPSDPPSADSRPCAIVRCRCGSLAPRAVQAGRDKASESGVPRCVVWWLSS